MTLHPDKPGAPPLFLEIRPGMRKALADAVDAFLNLLDQIDDDDDREDESELLEPGGDEEPTLGATTTMNQAHGWRSSPCDSCDEAEPSLGWTGHGRGHPQTVMRGYDDDREATTGPRDEEDDDSDKGELDGDYMDSGINPPHLPGGNGPTRRPGR